MRFKDLKDRNKFFFLFVRKEFDNALHAYNLLTISFLNDTLVVEPTKLFKCYEERAR